MTPVSSFRTTFRGFFIGIMMITKIHENLPIELNECVKCHWALPISEFRRDRNKKNNLKSWCKRCAHIRTDNTRQRERELYKLNPESRKASGKRWRIKNPSRLKERLYRYNLTTEAYQTLMLKQGNKCAICGIPQIELKHSLHIDHCHTTGKIRGLLCGRCNWAIGLLKDNINILKSAVKYLE